MQRLEKAQQVVASNVVAGTTGVGTLLGVGLADLAELSHQVGMICGGILSVLVLVNWIYVHVVKRKNNK